MKLHPVGDPFRLSVEYVDAGYVDGIPLVRPISVSRQALPVEREGIYYVVSTLVQNAYPDRNDLLIPAMLVRDAAGNITGCQALALRATEIL